MKKQSTIDLFNKYMKKGKLDKFNNYLIENNLSIQKPHGLSL